MFKKRIIQKKKITQPKLVRLKSTAGNWSFKNSGGAKSSSATVSQNSVQFGFPRITQIMYPGQTIRINSGWNLTEMPTGTVMHTIPHNSLIQSNIIATPQITQPGDTGPLTQTLYNNSDYPIRIQLEPKGCQNQQNGIFFMKPTGQQRLQGFDAGHLVNTFLGLAANIVPMFL